MSKHPKNVWADKPEKLLAKFIITLQQCQVMIKTR